MQLILVRLRRKLHRAFVETAGHYLWHIIWGSRKIDLGS